MLQVISLGRIVQDPALYANLVGKPVVIPDQYLVHRAVFNTSGTPVKPLFICGGGAPGTAAPPAMETPYFAASVAVNTVNNATEVVYTITRSDDPAGKRYSCTTSPTTVWREALTAAAIDFPSRKEELIAPVDSKGRLQVSGVRFYGLHLREVQDALLALPDGPAAFEAAAAALKNGGGHATPTPSQPTAAPAKASRKRASPAAAASVVAVEDATASSQPTTAAAAGAAGAAEGAAGGNKRPPQRKAKAEVVEVHTQEDDGSTAPPPAKRRRAAAKKSDSAAPVAPSASAAAVVCPDCGLAGTPFCAATGKPHEIAPCGVCGLRTAFCPVSGQPHAGAVQRENRQRGEVHLPGSTRRSTRKKAAAAAAPAGAADVSEVTVVSTQEEGGEATSTAKKAPRRKRGQAAPAEEGTMTEARAAASSTAAHPRRSRKSKKGDAADSTAAPSAQAAEKAGAAAGDAGDVPLLEAVKESIYVYPPLRPPLSAKEHHKAAHLLQETWRTQYGDGPVLPPAVATVPLAFVPVKRPTAGTARRGKKPAGGGAGGDAAKEEEGEEDQQVGTDDAAAPEVKKEKGDQQETAEDVLKWDGSPTTADVAAAAAAAPQPTMVHPLEVSQLAASVAGKRLTKFLLQYASERSQLDLLRSHAATTNSAGDGPGKKRARKSKDVEGGGEEGGGGGGATQQQEGEGEEGEGRTARVKTEVGTTTAAENGEVMEGSDERAEEGEGEAVEA